MSRADLPYVPFEHLRLLRHDLRRAPEQGDPDRYHLLSRLLAKVHAAAYTDGWVRAQQEAGDREQDRYDAERGVDLAQLVARHGSDLPPGLDPDHLIRAIIDDWRALRDGRPLPDRTPLA